MDEEISDILLKVESLPNDVKKWKSTEVLTERLSEFLKTLPCIIALSHESMRDRHWKELRIEVKEDFDENSAEFNLDKVFALNLLQHEEKIIEITGHAVAQLRIEKSLDGIEEMWTNDIKTNLEIDITYTKGSNEACYKIAGTEAIITLIEDHSGELAKHKSSPFYK